MVILVDTREQKPLPFKRDYMLTEIRHVKLAVGDYGCEYRDGSRPPLYFERKSLPDLFGTMTNGYRRFKEELQRAKTQQVQLVLLIEGTLREVYEGVAHSEFPGESMVKKLFMLWMKYDLLPVFCADRTEMMAYIQESYEAIGRLTKVTPKRVQSLVPPASQVAVSHP